MTQLITIKDTRDNLAEVIDKVAIGGSVFIVTKFGKPKAMITSIPNKKTTGIEKTFGMWKDRSDIKDTAKWVSDIRQKMSTRNA